MAYIGTSLTFSSVQGLLQKAFDTGTLNFADLEQFGSDVTSGRGQCAPDPTSLDAPALAPEQISTNCRQLEFYSSDCLPWTGTRLIGAMLTPVKRMYFLLLLCKILDDGLSFAAPLILGEFVDSMSSDPQATRQWSLSNSFSAYVVGLFTHGVMVHQCAGLAALLFSTIVVKAFVTTQYTYYLNLMAIRAHGSLMQAPLHAAVSMPAFVRGQFSEGVLQSIRYVFHDALYLSRYARFKELGLDCALP